MFFRDKENLAVITDHGVIEKLSRLARTEDELLRSNLALAISSCSDWSKNRATFGQSGAVGPLVTYLNSSSDLEVRQNTTLALYQLSKDPWNCVTMHQSGVVLHLLRLIGNTLSTNTFHSFYFSARGIFIGSDDETVQEAAADCLQNIRKLALACEKFRYQHLK